MSDIYVLYKILKDIKKAIGSQRKSDNKVYKRTINPVFKNLEPVVNSLLEMYQPVAVALKELEDNAQNEGVEKHIEKLVSAVNECGKKKEDTRSARIKVDAAACDLLKLYWGRDDEFAHYTCKFALNLRVIVGRQRSALGPPDSRHNKALGPADSGHFFSLMSATVKDVLTWQLGPDDTGFEIKYSRGQSTKSLSANLKAACQSINDAYEAVTYVHAELRSYVFTRAK